MMNTTKDKQTGEGTAPRVKEVSYSYPSSPNAKRYGFNSEGCFTVALTDAYGEHTVAGFATKEEAFRHADSLPFTYGRFSIPRNGA